MLPFHLEFDGGEGGGGGQTCTPNECTGCYRCSTSGTYSYYDNTCPDCGNQPPNGGTYNFSVVTNSPQGNDVSLCSIIQVEFNNIIDESTVNAQNFGLYDCGNDSCNGYLSGLDNLTLNGQFTVENDIIQFNLGEDYNQNHYYAVNIITNGITDEDGEALLVPYYWEFRTGDQTDTEPPTVSLVFPEDNQGDVCLTSYIKAEFSEDMDMLSLNNDQAFNLYEEIGNLAEIDFIHQAHNDYLILYPDSNYDSAEDYFPLLNGNIIKDACGNYLDGDGDGNSELSPIDDYPSNGPSEDWNFITGDNLYCSPEITSTENVDTYYDATTNLIINGHYLGNNPVLVFDESIVVDQQTDLCMGDQHWYDGLCVNEAWTEERIAVAIPVTGGDNNGVPAGENAVEVQINEGNVSANFNLLSPRIDALSPDQGGLGQFISILGNNFKEDENIDLSASRVYFRSNQDEYIIADLPCGNEAWQNEQIIIAVPEGLNIANSPYVVQIKKVYFDNTERWSNLADFYFNGEEAGPGLCFIDFEGETIEYNDEFTLSGFQLGDGTENREVILGDDYNSISSPTVLWENPVNGQDTTALAITPNLSSATDVGVRVVIEIDGELRFSNYLSVDITSSSLDEFYISYISPTTASVGEYVTIYGSGFGNNQSSGRTVKFFNNTATWPEGNFDFPEACSSVYWQDNQIIVKVPDIFNNLSFSSQIKVVNDQAETNAVDLEVNDENPAPSICSVNPDSGTLGTELEIIGDYLGDVDLITFAYGTSNSNDVNPNSTDDNLLTVDVPETQTGLISAYDPDAGYGNTWNFEYLGAPTGPEDVWDFYGWQFKTCDRCESPRVRIEECGPDGFSPSPAPGNKFVPLESSIYVEFEYQDGSDAEIAPVYAAAP